MKKQAAGKVPNPRVVYADIISHPHHVSDHHPQMSLYDRAAQFAPFAALPGYDDMIAEEARPVARRIELSEEEQEQLNQKLNLISDAIAAGTKPVVSITFFVPDLLKDGGRYEMVTEKIRRVDPHGQVVILDRKTGIAGSYESLRMADILEIHGTLVDQDVY